MILLPWLSEFSLELIVAMLAYRRQVKPLFFLLAFRALADFVNIPLYYSDHRQIYIASTWICGAAQYALLCFLVCGLAARVFKENTAIWPYATLLAAITGAVAGYGFAQAHTWKTSLLIAHCAASLCLSGTVFLAWSFKKGDPGRLWRYVAAGILVGTIGGSACDLITQYWSKGWMLYPIPALAALVIWNRALWPGAVEKMKSYRSPIGWNVPLGPKPVQSVRGEYQDRWVM